MKRLLYIILGMMAASMFLTAVSCTKDAPPEGAAVKNREQLPVMVTYGVSKMISDSGYTRYKFITEEWAVYDQTTPPRWDFKKGILILRFDEKMNIDLQITADTAFFYDQNLWELRGRVNMVNEATNTTFRSEELFWDMKTHEFYSNVWMKVITPDREIEGSRFRANEKMTKYEVYDDKGVVPMPKQDNGGSGSSDPFERNDASTTIESSTPPDMPVRHSASELRDEDENHEKAAENDTAATNKREK